MKINKQVKSRKPDGGVAARRHHGRGQGERELVLSAVAGDTGKGKREKKTVQEVNIMHLNGLDIGR